MDAFAEGLAWARRVCLALPETYEEDAWVGTRWRVRSNTFAHLLEIVDGYPLSFRSAGLELDAVLAGETFFGPLWNRGDVGVRLDLHADWDELAELVLESY